MDKVLVANRGEIALRVIRACQESGVATVAVYSTADEDALHVRRADESVCIGPPHARDSYLDAERLIVTAQQRGADSIHPGYGFLAENASFAAACRDADITFIGPTPEVIELMGDKSTGRRMADEAGVPTIPGTPRTASLAEALGAAEEIGYPVMVKAAVGGGGRGIRVARDAPELQAVSTDASREAGAAFGDEGLYIEKLLEGARHVEVQVLGDHLRSVVHVFERECSIQRRRQKIFEESPAPRLDSTLRAKLAAAAVRLAKQVNYTNAGTVEFLVDSDGSFYFIEMNTRIQVEHPITEAVTGIDLVKEQLRISSGEPLGISQEEIRTCGCAIEFRINAEDPANDFMPSPGEITVLRLPGGPGVRVDTAVFESYRIPPFYDSLIAKLVVWGGSREEAISRGRRALGEFEIEGVKTTIPLHRQLLDDETVIEGGYDIDFLETLLAAS